MAISLLKAMLLDQRCLFNLSRCINLPSSRFIISRIIEMRETIPEVEIMTTFENQTIMEEIIDKIVVKEAMVEEETMIETIEAAMTDQNLQITEISQKDPSSVRVYLRQVPAVSSMTSVTWGLRPRATRRMFPNIRA